MSPLDIYPHGQPSIHMDPSISAGWRILRDLVERYDGEGSNDVPGVPVVRFFEFFNEPDLINVAYGWAAWGYWSANGGGDGTAYSQMLCAVFPEVNGAGSEAMGGVIGRLKEWEISTGMGRRIFYGSTTQGQLRFG